MSVGAIVPCSQAAICYSGDLSDPSRHKYTLEYYLKTATQLVQAGAHVLCIKVVLGGGVVACHVRHTAALCMV